VTVSLTEQFAPSDGGPSAAARATFVLRRR
jgi:hypothetical protein